MNKTWDILRFEIKTLISRFSFWFGVLGIPIIGFVILSAASVISNGDSGANVALERVGKILDKPPDSRPQGFVDQAALIHAFPGDVDTSKLISYHDQSLALKDVQTGAIRGYYLIPANILKGGKIYYYRQEYDLTADQKENAIFQEIIRFNLLGGDKQRLALYDDPLSLETIPLEPPKTPQRDSDNLLTFFLPYAVMMLFYIIIMGSSSLMLSSVAKEKDNRVIETLLVSVTPTQLLMGKIIGLGLIGLFQVLIWGSSGLAMLRLGGTEFKLADSFQLSSSILIWGAVFFILGYLVYAAFMAGIGALAPNLREGSQATTLVVLPMILPLFLINLLIEEPDGPVSVFFSLFPLTSPTTMMLRLSATNVPLWQLLLAVLLLIGTAFLTIRAVAGMFRAQTLLSGQPFRLMGYFKAFFGRA